MCILFSLPLDLLFYVGEKLSPLDLWSLEIAFEGTRYETFITSLTTKLAHNLSKTYSLSTENMVSNVEDVRGPNMPGLIVTNAAAWPSDDHFFPRHVALFSSLTHMASNRLSQVQNHLSPPSALVLTSYSSDRRVVTITINNAARANCLSTPVLQAILDALRSINPLITLDSSVDSEDPIAFAERVCQSHVPNPVPKAVILKSAGKIFSSGHDLKEFHAAKGDYKKIHDIFELCNTMMLTIRRLPQTVISQVQGIATAAGTQLAAQAELCVASPSATFATPGVQRGGFCTTPSVSISRSISSPKQTLRMLLTGEQFSASHAYECGLVSHIADGDLDEYTSRLAAEIANAAGTTLFLGKRGFYEQKDLGIAEAYEFAGKIMARNFAMKDSREGVSAFIEKREARWD